MNPILFQISFSTLSSLPHPCCPSSSLFCISSQIFPYPIMAFITHIDNSPSCLGPSASPLMGHLRSALTSLLPVALAAAPASPSSPFLLQYSHSQPGAPRTDRLPPHRIFTAGRQKVCEPPGMQGKTCVRTFVHECSCGHSQPTGGPKQAPVPRILHTVTASGSLHTSRRFAWHTFTPVFSLPGMTVGEAGGAREDPCSPCPGTQVRTPRQGAGTRVQSSFPKNNIFFPKRNSGGSH